MSLRSIECQPCWRPALALAVSLAATPPIFAMGQKLSLAKIEKLLGVKTPDAVVAREVRTAGLDFAPSKATVEALRKKGAGPETLEAVRNLIWVGGYLSVEVKPVGAQVEVKGPGVAHAGPAANLPLRPGTYVVTVSKRNHKADSRTVRIEDGSRPSLSVTLSADPVYVANLERSISSSYSRPDQILQRSRELLEADPSNDVALNAIAKIHWSQSSPSEYKASARETLVKGKGLVVALMHEDPGTRGSRTLHTVQLSLSKQEIAYNPAPEGRSLCSLPKLNLPLASLQEVKVVENELNETSLLLRYRESGSVKRMNLFLASSRLERTRTNEPGRVVPPAKSAPLPMLRALAELIQDAVNGAGRPGAAEASLPEPPASGTRSAEITERPGSADSAPPVAGATKNAHGLWEASFRVGDTDFRMVLIPDGTYLMGSAGDQPQRKLKGGSSINEQPLHRVHINQSFWIGKFEVTQAQFKAVMGKEVAPSKGHSGGSTLDRLLRKAVASDPNKGLPPEAPIVGVSWVDAASFTVKLSLSSATRGKWSLPTEAQWEYACRAGTTESTYGPIDSVAWTSSNSGGTVHPVGQKAANGWGLHDMLGNAQEWCVDDWHSTYQGAPNDGRIWWAEQEGMQERRRVTRGGGYGFDPELVTASARSPRAEANDHKHQGFRVVFTPDPAAAARIDSAPPATPAAQATQPRLFQNDFLRAWVDSATVGREGNDLFAYLALTIENTSPREEFIGAKWESTSSLMDNLGRRWYFMAITGLGRQEGPLSPMDYSRLAPRSQQSVLLRFRAGGSTNLPVGPAVASFTLDLFRKRESNGEKALAERFSIGISGLPLRDPSTGVRH